MAGRSSLDQLDPRILEEVHAAIKRRATIDEILWMLKGLGANVSRSAVGRYSKQYADLASQQRELQLVATSFAGEFGSADDRQSRLLIQLVTSIATRAVMPLAAGNDVDIGGKELANLARAIKDITSAAKTDVDREKTIRAEEAKKVREAAAAAAETEAKAAGASEESIRRVRAAILGLKS